MLIVGILVVYVIIGMGVAALASYLIEDNDASVWVGAAMFWPIVLVMILIGLITWPFRALYRRLLL